MWYGSKDGPEAIFSALHNGFTIVIFDIQLHAAAAASTCDGLQQALDSDKCFVNLYITPMGECAFKPHLDIENNFVVQLAGSKRWTMYNTTARQPILDLCSSTVIKGDHYPQHTSPPDPDPDPSPHPYPRPKSNHDSHR